MLYFYDVDVAVHVKVDAEIFNTLEPVAKDVADLTPAWLNGALGHSGLRGNVTGVRSEPIGIGQMGRSFRVNLTYSEEQHAGPASLVAKLAGGGMEARQRLADGYRNEVMFYSHLVPSVDVSTPRCWYGAVTDDGTDFTLLLEDLHPARPGVQVESCSLNQPSERRGREPCGPACSALE